MEKKKLFSKMGFIYGTFAALMLILQLIASKILMTYYYDFTMKYSVELSLGLTFVVEHVICFAILILMVRKVPKETIVPKKFGAGKAICAFFMMYTLMEAGALLGNFIQVKLTGDTLNAATELMMASGVFPRVFVIGICAPIVEELIFRKFLIDRLIKYGAVFSCIVSGLMFGLIHGNFSQFFYAFLLGAFFAAIYIMTGNILNTIIYHMIVNISSSVIGVYVLEDFNNRGMESIPYIIYSCVIVLSAIVGIVLIIIKSKDFVPKDKDVVLESSIGNPVGAEEVIAAEETDETAKADKTVEKESKASALLSPGMIFYYVMMVVMFLVNYSVIKF